MQLSSQPSTDPQPASSPIVFSVRRTWYAVVAALCCLCWVALVGAPAAADPSVSSVEAELAKVWNEAEPLIEHYNAVHQQYEQNLTEQATLTQRLIPLEATLAAEQARVAAMAVLAYEGGHPGAYTSLMINSDPSDFIDSLSYVNELARQQSTAVSAVAAARKQYDLQKAPIDALVATLSQEDLELGDETTQINEKLAQLQTLRAKVYAAPGGGIGAYRPWTCPAQYLPTKGYQAAAWACSQTDKPYVWGAAGPYSYDCSGLTMMAWAHVGVYLPHNAYEQSLSMRLVSRADIQIGDLVFYFFPVHHVAIYVGDGHVVAAPQPGDVVRMQSVDLGPIHSIGRPA
jgi:cell wall-associated NlpC family hydrolase